MASWGFSTGFAPGKNGASANGGGPNGHGPTADGPNGGYHDWPLRADLRPRDGRADEWWSNLDDEDRLRQTTLLAAHKHGWQGGKRKEILGKAGSLRQFLKAMRDKRIAAINRGSAERARELRGEIYAAADDERQEHARVTRADRNTAQLGAQIKVLEAQLAELRGRVQQLTPGQRGDRFVVKEAAAAATATGLLDGSAFGLTLSLTGGPLWIRIFVATTVVLGLNVAIVAAGRTLAGFWRALPAERRGLKLFLIAVALVALATLVAGALIAAGDFRYDSIVNFGSGTATNPAFLVWVGGASALGAAISIAWLHYARPGLELNRQIRKAESRLRQLEGERQAAESAAAAASDRAYAIVREAKKVSADLQSLPERTKHRVEEARAAYRALRDLAEFSFKQGRLDREQHVEDPPPDTLSKRERKRLVARLEKLAEDAGVGRWN